MIRKKIAINGLKENIALKEFSNYKIGGPARLFFEAKTEEDIKAALAEAEKGKMDLFILGGGTNILIDDNGFSGMVLRPNIDFLELSGETIRVGAGMPMSQLLNYAIEKSLSGLEWAGGLPGTLGGAIRGNAGAFKGEIKDIIESVDSFDIKKLERITRNKPDCFFGYRNSIFKRKNGEEIILSATVRLKKGNRADIERTAKEKIDYRLRRHPLEYPNIGSIFKNVDLKKIPEKFHSKFSGVVKVDPFPVVPTAYLLSEAGLKGVSFGGAMISPKHPNFIVNVLHATALDVKNLIGLAKSEVKKKFGIKLEEEVQLL